MQKLVAVCIRQPIFAAMIILSLVVVGAASYMRLGVDRFPSVDLPTVRVLTFLPGASPEEIESQISQRLEDAINTVEGISQLWSISGLGSSIIIITFNLERDIETATQDVRDRIATTLRDLPAGADPPLISKFSNDLAPIMLLAVSSDRSRREITELADKVVKEQLERSAGVGEVAIVGGLKRAINVWIDAARLAAYRIPITAVRNAVVRQNADVPGGNITAGAREQTLRTMGRVVDPREFNNLVIATVNGAPIRIQDIGSAEDGTKEPRTAARLDGAPTVILEVRRQSGANTVEVINAVKENLARVRAQLPADVKVEIIRDQSRYIHAALHEINTHLILGSLLACLVVLAFMRNWRATFIAGVAIPTSVIATFGMMRALNFTLNSVTMLALVLMVGIVIDDAIVVLENIFRFVEEKKMRPFEAAREATAEIGLAVMATTLSLVVIFVPVSFMSSISGRFLYQFGITAAVSVMVSLLVSFTLTPMMSARLLRVGDTGGDHDAARSRRGFYAWLDWSYTGMLALSMRYRFLVALVALAVIASSVPLYKVLKQEYIPSDVDEAEFEVAVTAPEGTSLAAMDEVMQAVSAELRSIPGVTLVMANSGSFFLGSVNVGNAYVRIAPHEERTFSLTRLWHALWTGDPGQAFRGNYTQRQMIQEVRRRLKKFRDLRTAARNFPSFNIGAGNFEIDFAIRGPNLQTLSTYAEQLRSQAQTLGLVDADTTLKLNKPELRVEIDRARAADLGVDTEDIARALRLMVGGEEKVSRFRDPALNEDYDVQLRLRDGDRNDPDTIWRLYVPRQGSGLVLLDSLVKLVPGQSPSRIDRIDKQRMVSLRSGIAPGYALADRIEALRTASAALNMPAAYSTKVSGRGKELEKTFVEFIWAFILSLIFMYMILASQFESLVHPLTILLSLPLSVPFALLSLWYSGNTLNLYSALGILVLFGVVKKNAILQIDHTNRLRARGLERLEAIMMANRDRLRPILMTTLALVAGMLPLAIGTGPGSEERRAVAVVVIGGQTLSLLLTLLVTPVAYSIFDDIGALFRRRAPARRPQAVPEPVPQTHAEVEAEAD